MNLQDFIPFGITIEDLVALSSATFVVITVVTVWRTLIEKAPAQRRIKAIVNRRTELRQMLSAPKSRRRVETLTVARRILRHFKLMTGRPVELASAKLVRAGIEIEPRERTSLAHIVTSLQNRRRTDTRPIVDSLKGGDPVSDGSRPGLTRHGQAIASAQE